MIAAVVLGVVAVLVVARFALSSRSVARVEVTDDAVRVIPVGQAKLWSLCRAVTIPAARIASVELFDDGTGFGRQVKAGRFRDGPKKAFLVVGRRRPVVVIECPGAAFDRVVFSTPDPELAHRDIGRRLATDLP